jgi:thioredoxin 1
MIIHDIKTKARLIKFINDHPRAIIVLDFFATWCGPCQILGKILPRLNCKYNDEVFFIKIDYDKSPVLIEHYKIKAFPTIKIIYRKKIVHEMTGGDIQKIQSVINKYY